MTDAIQKTIIPIAIIECECLMPYIYVLHFRYPQGKAEPMLVGLGS